MRAATLLLTAMALGCLSPLADARSSSSPPIADLVLAVETRNTIGHEVAASKFPTRRPVEDRVREAQVIADKRAQAEIRGLDPDAIAFFYRQLIEANKLVQYVDATAFELTNDSPQAPPLDQLRAKIDAADQVLLGLWPQVEPLRSRPECALNVARSIMSRPAQVQTALIRALVGFCQPAGI